MRTNVVEFAPWLRGWRLTRAERERGLRHVEELRRLLDQVGRETDEEPAAIVALLEASDVPGVPSAQQLADGTGTVMRVLPSVGRMTGHDGNAREGGVG